MVEVGVDRALADELAALLLELKRLDAKRFEQESVRIHELLLAHRASMRKTHD